MTPVTRVLAALSDHGVRPCGTGWIARCPAHDDRHASLCIGEGEGGRALLCCHSGCELANVLRAIGLTTRDLFAGPQVRAEAHTFYDYEDECGTVLFQVVRIPRPDGKRFAQRRPDGPGRWIWDVAGVRRVLYRLPELLAADPTEPVFVVEGEEDADNLASRGLIATTNPGGAGKWRREYSEALRGRHVAILPDNDQPGAAHGKHVAWSLENVAESVHLVQLPGLPDHGDVSDWLGARHTIGELRDLCSAASGVKGHLGKPWPSLPCKVGRQ